MVEKSLDRKLARIAADSSCQDFILADAKDPDLAFGIAAPGSRGRDAGWRSLPEFREIIRQIVRQQLVDILLMSASTNEVLTIEERLFDNSPVTAASRANDTTDIWLGHSGAYTRQPSLPFRTPTIDHIQCGKVSCRADERSLGADLGLYSITLNNDALADRESLAEYRAFRLEAETKGFRHFLEVFAPNAPEKFPIADVPRFVNDSIARLLGGITRRGRPLFLKMPYFGPAAMEALASYDPSLVIGILGGTAGTTHDAFKMLADAKRYGARAALFGRKINQAEDQLAFIQHLRWLADGEIAAEEAVRSYHGHLEKQQLTPHRNLADDLALTQ